MRRLGLAIVVFSTACTASPLTPAATAAPTRVDVLDFLIGDPALWPRTGTQQQHQIVDWAAQEVCWVKYGRSEMFECWRWDDQWIYHAIDHGLDGDTGESYRFTDGRWLPRYLDRDTRWTLDLPTNRVRWFTPTCTEVRGPQGLPVDAGPNLFPIRLEAWIEPRDVGPTLGGLRDVLVLSYTPYAPGAPLGPPELFRFAQGAGWYRWESVRGTSVFDRLGGVAVARGPDC